MGIALVMMTDPGNPEANGRMVHLLTSAKQLRDNDQDVAIYLHGAAVNWATAFVERSNPFTQHYGDLFDEMTPLIAGACDFCTHRRFEQTESMANLGIGILGESDAHHTVADLLLAGDQVITL